MAAEDKIDSIVDRQAVEADIEYLKKLVKDALGAIQGAKGASIEIMSAKNINEYTAAIGKAATQTDELKKANDELGKVAARRRDEQKKLDQQIATARLQQQQYNKELKTNAEFQTANNNSLAEARVLVKRLIAEREQLNLATVEGRKRQAELNQEIDRQNDFIKSNVSSLEKQKINVGNYANSLSASFDKIADEIRKLKTEQKGLQDLSAKNPIGFQLGGGADKLAQVTQKINALTEATEMGFKVTGSAAGQVRNLENAYVSLASSGAVTEEFLREFRSEIGKVKDNVNDLRESIKLAASDTQGLDVMIGAAQAVAGAFGVAQGITALWGTDNEELQKTLVKLNGVMTILNGLQAIQAELKKKDNILTTIQIGLQRAYALAVGQSTGAMRVFRTVLASTGIGLLIVGLGILISKMEDWLSTTDDAAEAQKKLNDAVEQGVKHYNDYADAIGEANERILKQLEAAGASEEALASKRISLLETQLAMQKRAYDLASAQLQNFDAQKIAAGEASEAYEEEYKRAYDNTENAAKKFFDLQDQLEEARLDKVIDTNKKIAENSKEAADRQKDIDARNAKARFEIQDLTNAANVRFAQKLLEDEKKSFDIRLMALQDWLTAREKQISDAAKFDASKAGLTALEIQAIEKKKQDALNQLYLEGMEKRREIIKTETQMETDLRESFQGALKKMIDAGLADEDKKRQEDLDKTKEFGDKKKELYKELYTELIGLSFDFFKASFEREANAIQDQIDLLEERKQKEIETVSQSIANAQDRAAAIIEIEARAGAERDRLERQQRRLAQERARFERAESIANIIAKTAEAIVGFLARPGGTAGITLSVLAGAIGAAQIARVLATPIPRYGDGTENHGGGLMEVGDKGRSELVETPDGRMYVTPSTSTIVDAPRGTKVYKDTSLLGDTVHNRSYQLSDMPKKSLKEVTGAVRHMEKSIVRAINRKPTAIIQTPGRWKTMTQAGHSFRHYLDGQL